MASFVRRRLQHPVICMAAIKADTHYHMAFLQLVMTTLTWLPKSDSRRSHNYAQTDGSGSGVDVPGLEMPVESHSRGGSPSDDDEEYSDYNDYYDYAASSGYGSGDHFLDETPEVKGSK